MILPFKIEIIYLPIIIKMDDCKNLPQCLQNSIYSIVLFGGAMLNGTVISVLKLVIYHYLEKSVNYKKIS